MKKHSKRRWFEKDKVEGEPVVDPILFSKTIEQHSKDLKQKKLIDEDGFEILPEDNYGYSSDNWELDRKLMNTSPSYGGKKADRKTRYETNKEEYGNAYNSYEKTGVWSGYYRQPQLTYKFVQQMANALSAKHNVKVEIGRDWKVDLLSKTLTYNPASLIYGTKSELLATLMHEIGKLRYVKHHTLLENKYLKLYGVPAREVLEVYEDLRTDYLMLQVYEGAPEIYESIIPTIEAQVKKYMEVGEAFRKLVSMIPNQVFQNIIYSYGDDPKQPKLKEQLHRTFGTVDMDAVKIGLAVLESKSETVGTIYEWCGEMLSEMYVLSPQGHKQFENIKDKIKRTTHTIDKAKVSATSQTLVDYLDTATYPVVEDLLKDAHEKNSTIQEAFPEMPASIMSSIMQSIHEKLQHGGQGQEVQGRDSKSSRSTIPPEWQTGDYKTLKDSVSMEIKELVRRLTFLRREELTVRYKGDEKRGKLNAKKLYKSSVGSRRLFKRKVENLDTVRSFAFSILLDVSGSMDGERITHTTRALIILAEVFKKIQIPFEVAVFSDGAKNIKPFEKPMDKNMERKIGGLVNHRGGGTNLEEGLEELEIHSQPEKNKVVIVLTDGGVFDVKRFDTDYFIPWEKKGITSVGFGVECEEHMKYLCQGNSRILDNASQLPNEFSRLLKELIKR